MNRETKALLTGAQKNAIKTNHIKAKIDKTRENSKCRVSEQRDETVNHIS